MIVVSGGEYLPSELTVTDEQGNPVGGYTAGPIPEATERYVTHVLISYMNPDTGWKPDA